MSRELEYRMQRHAARATVVKELNDFAKIEAEERAKEQTELVKALEAEVLAALKGQVRSLTCVVAAYEVSVGLYCRYRRFFKKIVVVVFFKKI